MSKIVLTSQHPISENLRLNLEQQLQCSEPTVLSPHSLMFNAPSLTHNQRQHVRDLSSNYQTDVIFLKNEFKPNTIKVMAFDMDSTLINIECIDEIARECGVVDEVSKITEASMRGEIKNFTESLQARVKLLKGTPIDALERVYKHSLRLNPGVENLIHFAKNQGIKTLLVSGGFTFFADKVQQLLGLDAAYANTLEIMDGFLTGNVLGQIVDGEHKAYLLEKFCQQFGVTTQEAVVFGDGSNDLPMMALAGLSIGYQPKPIVQEKADGTFRHVGLDGIIDLLKYGS
jgi:phosphoserine phosphatase